MVIIGVCAMAKKVLSQPMTEILDRIRAFGDCQVIIFQELMILNSDIEDWPKVEVLIAFHSTGFPLNKAIMYSELEPKPFLVNDLILQRTLLDRRLVYKILEKNCISTPHYLVMNRDADGNSTQSFEEYEGHICIDGQLMKKPFVEKPVSGDDHNIRVYYPDGGGCRRLFRKIKDRSSEISHENCVVRRNGSYVYEEFVETGRDIKVFAVGSSYAHSESRKSPTVDGIVERNRFGKERRQIERLTDEELSMATMVTKCFKQTVCGLDILRNDNKSYVIDVNGWSFVKGDARYYDHCANILRNICRNYHQNEAKPISDARQLVGILGVFRHSDRTPKQKIKILSTDPEIKSLVSIGKLKTEADRHLLLTHVQSICFRSGDGTTSHDNLKYLDSLRSLECVLLSSFKSTQLHVKQDPKGSAAALVVCKWGGEITESGIQQSLNLGLHIRQSVADEVGSDLSNFISNTAAHSSHMDRVRMSAEKFLEAFSASSPSTFYKVDEVDPLVRFSSAAKEAIQRSKNTLEKTLLEYRQDDAYDGATPIYSFGISTALKVIDSPQERLAYLLASLKLLIQYIADDQHAAPVALSYHGESVSLLFRRWQKLYKSFRCNLVGAWDVTKIPDIFDSAAYDLLHNFDILPEFHKHLSPVFQVSKMLSDFVVPQEYGVSVDEKRRIAFLLGKPIIERIINFCLSFQHGLTPRSRCCFYFLNESHMHCLRNAILWSGISENQTVADNLEMMQLLYCSHLLVKVYRTDKGGNPEFSVAVEFSPGAVEFPDLVRISHIQQVAASAPVVGNLPVNQFCMKLRSIIALNTFA